jgi:hypothetical protein
MPYNNPSLYNAAITGITGGVEQRWLQAVDTSLPDKIAALATVIDSSIAPIVGGATDAQAELMSELCEGVFSGRYLGNEHINAYNNVIAALVATFNAISVKLTYVSPGPPPVVAPAILYSVFSVSSPPLSVIYTLTAQSFVYQFAVMIITPFNDPAATVAFGTSGNPNLFFDPSQSMLSSINQFESEEHLILPAGTQLTQTVNLGSASTGIGLLLWSVSPL